MVEKEIKDRLVGVIVRLCPEREKLVTKADNTIEEHIEFLEVLSKYIPFDKEAAVREAYELGKFEGESR